MNSNKAVCRFKAMFSSFHNDMNPSWFLFVFTFLIYASFGKSIFYDPDSGWHFMAGQYIVNNLSVPVFDPFTFSSDQQWYNISWLFDVIVYLIMHYLGHDALYYTTAFISAWIIMEVFLMLKAWGNIKVETRLLVCMLVAISLDELRFIRPQLVCYLFAIYTMLYCHLGRTNYKYYFYMPLLTLLWANMHGSFLIIYSFLGCHFLEAVFHKNAKLAKVIVLSGVLCLVSNCINPIGYKIFFATYRTLHSAMSQYIAEWHPWYITWSYSFSAVLLFIIISSMVSYNDKIPFLERFITFFWMIVSLKSIRFFVLFSIFATPYLALTIDKLVPKLKIRINNYIYIITTIVMLFAHPKIKDDWMKSRMIFMHDTAINYVMTHYPNEIIFNDYTLGGYFVYLTNGKLKYFLDGRAGTAFTEKFIEEYIELSFTKQRGLDYFINKYKFHVAIIKLNSAEGMYLNTLFAQKWRLVYSDRDTVVYEDPHKDFTQS